MQYDGTVVLATALDTSGFVEQLEGLGRIAENSMAALRQTFLSGLSVEPQQETGFVQRLAADASAMVQQLARAGGDIAGNITGSIRQGIQGALAGTLLGGGASAAQSQAKGAGAEIGAGMMDGLKTGVVGSMGSARAAIIGAVAGIVGGVKDELEIRSPSGVFRDEVGRMMADGIAEGFLDGMPGVYASVRAALDGSRFGLEGSTARVYNSSASSRSYTFNQPVSSPYQTARAIERLERSLR